MPQRLFYSEHTNKTNVIIDGLLLEFQKSQLALTIYHAVFCSDLLLCLHEIFTVHSSRGINRTIVACRKQHVMCFNDIYICRQLYFYREAFCWCIFDVKRSKLHHTFSNPLGTQIRCSSFHLPLCALFSHVTKIMTFKNYVGIPMLCLVLSVLFPTTFSASCENDFGWQIYKRLSETRQN